MDYIVSRKGVTHAGVYRRNLDPGPPWVADTRCGQRIFGERAGACIVPLIDCGLCKRGLRKDGWSV